MYELIEFINCTFYFFILPLVVQLVSVGWAPLAALTKMSARTQPCAPMALPVSTCPVPAGSGVYARQAGQDGIVMRELLS